MSKKQMTRELYPYEHKLLLDTLELMRTGYHESLGPFYYPAEGITVPIQDPVPEDPEPYLKQLDNLMVEEYSGCEETCFGCNRNPERRPCGSIMFISEEKRKSLEEKANGGSGFPIAESHTEDGLTVVVFANDGLLTEMETY